MASSNTDDTRVDRMGLMLRPVSSGSGDGGADSSSDRLSASSLVLPALPCGKEESPDLASLLFSVFDLIYGSHQGQYASTRVKCIPHCGAKASEKSQNLRSLKSSLPEFWFCAVGKSQQQGVAPHCSEIANVNCNTRGGREQVSEVIRVTVSVPSPLRLPLCSGRSARPLLHQVAPRAVRGHRK
jgi:hypothetical protein